MLVARRTPDLMSTMFNELLDWNRWNNNLCGVNEEHHLTPKMNVSESDKDFRLELCIPGMKKEDLNLTVDADNNLVVEMQHKEEKKDNDEKRHFLRREFSTTQFKQMLTLPENVKKDQISAKVENGILYITLPKFTVEEQKQLAQTIAIE
ncbi:MAG: Hsp20/alpha crystallin family protein [Bacteroidales bacterium]|nr:Hsp20/alpha crystallin family protein [Bacteroidales bacterium]